MRKVGEVMNPNKVTLTAVATLLVSLLPLFYVVDARYVKANQLTELKDAFNSYRHDYYEEEIEELNHTLAVLTSKDPQTLKEHERREIIVLRNRRDRYLRRIDFLKKDEKNAY